MSMTREQSREMLERDFELQLQKSIEDAYNKGDETEEAHLTYGLQMAALSILAPEPRDTPPTEDEVGDGEECWYCILDSWQLDTGQRVREFWAPDEGERWLPLSALPMPKGGEG